MNVIQWTLSIIALVTVAALPAFAALTFLTAFAERQRMTKLKPDDGRKPPRGANAKMETAIDDARAAQFVMLGRFLDGDSGWKQGTCTLLLSEDRRDLLLVKHLPLNRYLIITQTAQGFWLMTSSTTGATDISGMEDEQMLPDVPFAVVWYYHDQRVDRTELPWLEFDANRVTDEILAHEQAVRDALTAQGLARLRSADGDWSFNLRGAWRLTAASMASLMHVSRDMTEARRKAAEFERAYSTNWKQEPRERLASEAP